MGERTCLGTTNKTRSRTHVARILTRFSLRTKLWLHWCSGVGQHRCSHLRASMGGVNDHKANTFLTKLNLDGNKVGDSGATALAQAVKATVATCELHLFQGMCFLLPPMSRYTVVLAVGVVRLLCNLCVLLLCFFFCVEGKLQRRHDKDGALDRRVTRGRFRRRSSNRVKTGTHTQPACPWLFRSSSITAMALSWCLPFWLVCAGSCLRSWPLACLRL